MENFERIEDRSTWDNTKTLKVMERMQILYETNKWHDCVFKLWKSDGAEELIFAHKLVLASSSPVFEALCFGPMAEKNPIEVPDIDPVAFRMLLQFIYTDCVEFKSVEIACNVLYASKKYLIYSLVDFAISDILCQINESNCLQIYNFGTFIQEDRIIKEAWSYLCSHLDSVLKYITYESLSTELVRNLVNEDALNGDEILVYKICLMWAEKECENNNLEKNNKNLRKVLIKAGILSKIRWFTLSLKEFEEGPKKSGILTNQEIRCITNILTFLKQSCLETGNQNEADNLDSDCEEPNLITKKWYDVETLQNMLHESNFFPLSVNDVIKVRKKIQLKKFHCHRFIEVKSRPTLDLQSNLKVRTHIVTNRSVRLTAIFINAQILPTLQLNTVYPHTCDIDREYDEKLVISIWDSNDQILFSGCFFRKVRYGSFFKVPFKTSIIIERHVEHKIQVNLLNSSENYLFGVRTSVLKFPSGLCVTFKEQANTGEGGKFVEANDMSIVSGLELHL